MLYLTTPQEIQAMKFFTYLSMFASISALAAVLKVTNIVPLTWGDVAAPVLIYLGMLVVLFARNEFVRWRSAA
jgi:hypothetical protein